MKVFATAASLVIEKVGQDMQPDSQPLLMYETRVPAIGVSRYGRALILKSRAGL